MWELFLTGSPELTNALLIKIMILMPVVILGCHYIGDYVFQPTHMAIAKATDLRVLLFHCAIYATVFFIFVGPVFATITLVAHLLVDVVTSRMRKNLCPRRDNYKFHLISGFDQCAHVGLLFYTFWLELIILSNFLE